MAAIKGGTGLEYTRTVDEAEEQKQRLAVSVNRMYTIASYVFIIGLIAVGALCVISVLNEAPKFAIICEIVVFVCLVLLLVLIMRSKRRVNEQRRHSERYPYKSVDKKEIDNIFNLIADEEKKRERLDRFAMSNTSGKPQRSEPEKAVEESKASAKDEKKSSVPEKTPQKASAPLAASEPEEEEDSGMIHIFPDQEENEMVSVLDDELNDTEIKMKAMEEKEEEPATEKTEKASEAPKKKKRAPESEETAEGEPEEAPKKKRPRDPDDPRAKGKRPPQGAKSKKRPPNGAPRDPRAQQGAPQNGKKRRPPQGYDPYYGGAYYYDEYGRPIRRPPPYDPYYGGAPYYYDEYGQPVRRREPAYGQEGAVYYDEYGRPIRRRPPQGMDPRREEAARRKRAAGADPAKRRPDPTKAGQPAQPGAAKQSKAPQTPVQESKRTAAPVAMPSLKKEVDDEHITVFIPYEDEMDSAYDASNGANLRANRQSSNARKGGPAVAPRPVVVDESEYSPQDMEAVPIVIPDDDYSSRYDDDEQAYAPPAASAARNTASQPSRPARNVPDYYYEDDSSAEEDTGVVVVPEFEDFDNDEDRYSRGRFAGSGQEQAYQPPVKKQSAPAYTPDSEEDYSYEDEGVVVLPHDEGYESYLEKVKEEEEKKRIEERKLARKKSGKIALTIRKVRRKKIHRKSRRYKRFRASVIPLAKYLSSYEG